MPKIVTALVQVGEHAAEILRRPCFPVNLRLMRNNPGYFKIISDIVAHMKLVMATKFSDYAHLQGISGANVGIPFNIVIIYHKEKMLVMLNPVVISKSKLSKVTLSNCGSINLAKPIKVRRATEVTVRYVPFTGDPCLEHKEEIFKSGTVQHEIEHNLGILIIDKEQES